MQRMPWSGLPVAALQVLTGQKKVVGTAEWILEQDQWAEFVKGGKNIKIFSDVKEDVLNEFNIFLTAND